MSNMEERLLSITFSGGSFCGQWETAEEDIGYLIRIFDGDIFLDEIYFPGTETELPVQLYTPEYVSEGKEYRFCLNVVTEQAEQTAKIPEYSQRLQRLADSLTSHRTETGDYVLNTEVLESERLVSLMKQFLYVEELYIRQPSEPILVPEERALKLQGNKCSFCFYVDDSSDLQMYAVFEDGTFSLLKNTYYEKTIIRNTCFYFTSMTKKEIEGGWLEEGLYFAGEMALPTVLNNSSEKEKVQTVRFIGSIGKKENLLKYQGRNCTALEAFTLYRNDGSTALLRDPALEITVAGEDARIYLTGSIMFSAELDCTVKILFTEGRTVITVDMKHPEEVMPSMTSALAFVEGDELSLMFPESLRSQEFVRVRKAGYIWNAPNAGMDMRYIEIGAGDKAIVLISDVLELADWKLSLNYGSDEWEGIKRDTYSAELEGTFLLENEKKIRLGAVIWQDAEWKVYLSCEEGSWLTAFCKLAGIPTSALENRLSLLRKGMESFSLDEVSVDFLPAEQKITDANLFMSQTESWEVIPSLLEIKDIKVCAELKYIDGWDYDITAEGTVQFGNGEKASQLFVAVPLSREKSLLVIEAESKGVALPSFEELFRLVGVGDGSRWIPSTFWDLNDLRISKLEIAVDLDSAPTIEKFALGVATARPYVFSLGSQEFSINKIELFVDSGKDGSLVFTGKGELLLFGMRAQVQLGTKGENRQLLFYIKVSEEEAKNLDFEKMADSFVEEESRKYKNLPIPASFSQPAFEEIAAYLDSAEKCYGMSGRISHLGQGIFAAVQLAEEKGYLLAAVLDEDFSFAGILPPLAALDRCVKIRRAGILLSSMTECSPEAVWNQFPSDMIPKNFPKWNEKLRAGLFFYGKIELSSTQFGNLLRLGAETGQLEVDASAYLPRLETDTEVMAVLNDFELLSVFHFRNIRFCYRVSQEKQFDLDGELSVQVGDSPIDFAGTVYVGETSGSFAVKTQKSIERPLGIPGLTFQNLELRLDITFADESKETSYVSDIEASVIIGPMALSGRLALVGSQVKACSVSLDRPLNIDDLFAAVFARELWPAGILDITVRSGSFRYAPEKCRIGQEDYEKGGFINTALTVYGFSFAIAGSFQEEAFAISGTAEEPISVGVLRITGTKFLSGPGISFRADERSRMLGITGGIELFGERLLDINMLGYDLQNRCFAGELAYNGTVTLFHGKIRFTWDEKKGVHIDEFPMQFVEDALDFAELLGEASKMDKSGCKALTGMLFDKVVQTQFEITPSFEKMDKEQAVIELLPKYRVTVAEQEIITASMKKLQVKVPLPQEVGFTALADMIISTITDNAVSIARQILDDADSFAKLMLAVGTVKGTQEVFDALLCRGDKGMVSGMSELNKAKDYAKAAKDAAGSGGGGSIGGAAGAAAGAGGSAAGAGSSFDAAAAFFGGIGGGFIFIGGGSSGAASRHEEEAKKRKEEARKAEEEAREAVRSMLEIRELSAEETADRLIITWKDIREDGLSLEYHIRIVGNGAVFAEETIEAACKEVRLTAEETEKFEISVYAVLTWKEETGDYVYTGDVSRTVYTAGKPLELLTNALPEARTGEKYEYAPKVEGGVRPLLIKAHGLPKGLRIVNGIISGVPMYGGGEMLVDISVTDARGKEVKKRYWMTVR